MNYHAVMPFGKWQDYDIVDVMAAEPSYLAWFFVCAEAADEEILSAIARLPGFGECLDRFARKVRRPDVLARIPAALLRYESMTMSVCSPADLDGLCDRLFNPQAGD